MAAEEESGFRENGMPLKGRKSIYSATRRSAERQGCRVWRLVHGEWPQVEARKEGVEKPGQGGRKMCP